VRFGSLKGTLAWIPAETGPRSVDKGPGPLRQNISPFWRRLRKKDWNVRIRRGVSYGIPFSSCFWFPMSSLARVTSFFHLQLISWHIFVPVPSLPLLLVLSFQKVRTFACRSELLFLTTSMMGVNAAALSTDSAGLGL
jgi:hypothetical protein